MWYNVTHTLQKYLNSELATKKTATETIQFLEFTKQTFHSNTEYPSY